MNAKLRYFALTLALIPCLALCFERHAYAYVDPGSGLLVCQSIGTLFAGALFYFRLRVRNLIRKVSSKQTNPPDVLS